MKNLACKGSHNATMDTNANHKIFTLENTTPFVITIFMSIMTGITMLMIKKHCFTPSYSINRSMNELWVIDNANGVTVISEAFNLSQALAFTEDDLNDVVNQLGQSSTSAFTDAMV